MSTSDHNTRQIAARDFERNLVVVAGAGTGKTSLLVERVLHLVLEHGVLIERVAAITFTEKAASEMRERIEEGLQAATVLLRQHERQGDAGEEAKRVLERLFPSEGGSDETEGTDRARVLERADKALASLDDAVITTIHSFASDILKRRAGTANVDPEFRLDDGEQAAEALFGEMWDAHLVEVFGGDDDVSATWQALLKRVSIEDVKVIARKLSSFKLADAFLADGEIRGSHLEDVPGSRQGSIARELGESCLEDVKTLQAELDGVSGLNKNVAKHLTKLEEIFASLAKYDGAVPVAVKNLVGQLSKTVSLGKNADVPNEKLVSDRLRLLIDTGRRVAGVDETFASHLQAVLGTFVRRYLAEYIARGWMSFDGMIVMTRNLLRDHPAVRKQECARFDSLLVDEFQDNDPLQYEIAFYLAAAGSSAKDRSPGVDAYELELTAGKLFIVGDPKQSIYRFRGADIGAFNRAVSTIVSCGGSCLELTSNFRSVPELVEPLNDLFDGYFSKELVQDPVFLPIQAQRPPVAEPRIEILSVGEAGAKVQERRHREGSTIAQVLAEGVAAGDFKFGDTAILLRALSNVGLYLQPLRSRGIPYVVAGGGHFYKRYEVELLITFLRAVVNGADTVALVSWLRSPVAGVADEELQRYATQEESGWSRLAEPDQNEYPQLSAALRVLRDFVRRHHHAPIDELARFALEETSLRLAMAASYEGAQRVVNLEKAVRRIAELAANGRRSPEEVLNYLEEVEASEQGHGDSPLADETVDSVRVLTIHGSKGLEWPVVFVADIARAEGSKRSDPHELEVTRGRRGRLPLTLALSVRGYSTPAHLSYRLESQEHAGSESKRLLYVAATRARERLILVASASGRSKEKTWVRPLRTWGYHVDNGFPQETAFAGGRVIHRRLEAVREFRALKPQDSLTPGLLEGVKRFNDARSSAEPAARNWLQSPSGLGERGLASVDDDSSDVAALPLLGHDERVGATARAIGTAVHLLLEVWDRGDAEWLVRNADRAARVAAAGEGVDASVVAEQVRGVLLGAKREGVFERLASTEILARELPVLYRDDEGTVWHGSIDVVTGSAVSPEVVDYKTSRSRSAEQLEVAHEPQLACYKEGLRRALGLKSAPPARIEALIVKPSESGDAEMERNAVR